MDRSMRKIQILEVKSSCQAKPSKNLKKKKQNI